MAIKKKVFVGLSGGVDSSVAALRLVRAGYEVTGVFIKVWHPDFLPCNWEAERLDAMRVAAKLDIPFLTCDAEAVYRDDVAEYFISEYKAGRTPNPDVMCNKYVKFGAFFEYAQKNGADFIATGHYAQKKDGTSSTALYRGSDASKDQSYFLWSIKNEQLDTILFPIGSSAKTEIRNEAKKFGLLTAQKQDSQGICFLGQVDIPEFLSHYIDLETGPVLNEEGLVIGEHQGALVYTTGQRHGFSVTKKDTDSKPRYVIARDFNKNTITVSERKPKTETGKKLLLKDCNFIDYEPLANQQLEIQTRYRQKPTKATVVSVNESELNLEIEETAESISLGQSCVLYTGDKCLGGGIISKCQ